MQHIQKVILKKVSTPISKNTDLQKQIRLRFGMAK